MRILLTLLVSGFFLSVPAQAHEEGEHNLEDYFESLFTNDEPERVETSDRRNALACAKATKGQKTSINQGNQKKTKFLAKCKAATNNSAWCDQLIRPNPTSKNVFQCTYGASQPHQLIHPNESTWTHAINAVKLIQALDAKGMKTCLIYNWWRPQPYNRNVGGAAGRHPFGTSVDVRFCDEPTAELAFNELCRLRRQGKIRAIGFYGTSALHFGMGDSKANTWGRSCS